MTVVCSGNYDDLTLCNASLANLFQADAIFGTSMANLRSSGQICTKTNEAMKRLETAMGTELCYDIAG
jgi:hypothetical protein